MYGMCVSEWALLCLSQVYPKAQALACGRWVLAVSVVVNAAHKTDMHIKNDCSIDRTVVCLGP